MAQLETVYEVPFTKYESRRGNQYDLEVVIEFEDDEELGLMATFYAAVKGMDKEFFAYSFTKSSDEPDMEDKEWMKHCIDLAKRDMESGEIDFSDIKKWLDR